MNQSLVKSAKIKFLVIAIGLIALLILFLAKNLSGLYQTPILMYHSLNSKLVGTYAAVSPSDFFTQMRFIKNNGYNVLALSQYCRLLRENKKIPPKSVVITFDDGYDDNLAAFDVLRRFDFAATFFVTQSLLGQKGYLSVDELSYLANASKIEIGSHTLTHAYLPHATDQKIETEINDSQKKLNELGFLTNTLAYPSGGFDQRVLKQMEESAYLCACTTNRGYNKKLNPWALQRIKITDKNTELTLWIKLSGFYNIFRKPNKPDH